jgi:hypothetical protein
MAHWLEWQDWANPILQQPYAAGMASCIFRKPPGVGLDWDEKAVTAHLAGNFLDPSNLSPIAFASAVNLCGSTTGEEFRPAKAKSLRISRRLKEHP